VTAADPLSQPSSQLSIPRMRPRCGLQWVLPSHIISVHVGHRPIALYSSLPVYTILARSSSTSFYLNSSVARYLPSRTLRSQNTNLPRTKTVFDLHAFRVAAPTVFYSLPQDIRSTNNICAFCRLLKTFYFRNAFNHHERHHLRLRFNIFC